MVDGAEKYLTRTEEEYIEPVKPTPQHPNIEDGTAAQIRAMNAANDLWKINYAVFLGFCRGC